MRGHASTRERLPIHRFYAEALAGIPPAQSVLDIGCGLNPLAIPWMGLPADVRYTCCDIDRGLVDFLNQYLAIAGIDGKAELRDVVTAAPPTERVHLALALKLLPTLDQLRRDAGISLLRALPVSHVVVSFPGRSLGGPRKRHGRALCGAIQGGHGDGVMERARVHVPWRDCVRDYPVTGRNGSKRGSCNPATNSITRYHR